MDRLVDLVLALQMDDLFAVVVPVGKILEDALVDVSQTYFEPFVVLCCALFEFAALGVSIWDSF